MSIATKVAIWPDGTWCSLDEKSEMQNYLTFKSDDYKVVAVTEWDSDGSPDPKYFIGEECENQP